MVSLAHRRWPNQSIVDGRHQSFRCLSQSLKRLINLLAILRILGYFLTQIFDHLLRALAVGYLRVAVLLASSRGLVPIRTTILVRPRIRIACLECLKVRTGTSGFTTRRPFQPRCIPSCGAYIADAAGDSCRRQWHVLSFGLLACQS